MFFESIDDCLRFYQASDDLIEYYYLSQQKSGCPVDLYLDDSESYHTHQHPLWIYVCDGYGHDEFYFPVSVGPNPQIEIDGYAPNIPEPDLSRVFSFIRRNEIFLKMLADGEVDSPDFSKHIRNQAMRIAESQHLDEMASINTDVSGLGFTFFIDNCPRQTQHKEYRIKYPISKEYDKEKSSYVPMSISENPEFLPPSKVTECNSRADHKRKKLMQDFIKRYLSELKSISDGKMDLDTFKENLKAERNASKESDPNNVGKTYRITESQFMINKDFKYGKQVTKRNNEFELRQMIKESIRKALTEDEGEDMLKTGDFSNHGEVINVGNLVNLNTRELFKQYSAEMWKILVTSYDPHGGLKSYRSERDFDNKGHFAKVVLDKNGEILACETYRKMEDSFKVVSYGCIQTPLGKLALQQIIQNDIINFDLHYWAEVSDAIEHYFKKYNGFPMPNTMASEILKIPASEIEVSQNDKVHYERKIGVDREPYTKMIFGIKDVNTFNKVLHTIENTYGDFMKEVNTMNEGINRYTIKQAIYIIENIYRLHEESGFNELIPTWYNALRKSINTLESCNSKTDIIMTYIGYARYLLQEMPLLKLQRFGLAYER